MKIIIFAGGTGKRLWPLSRKKTPKQFLKLFNNESSLENSYNLIKRKFAVEDIYVSTNTDYVQDVLEIIPDLPKDNIIIEPISKDTGPAVMYAMLKISSKFPNEPVVIRWQNSLIKNPNKFIDALEEADSVFQSNAADMVYLAVESLYPNTGTGHIKLGEKLRDLNKAISLHNFGGFVEKPVFELAKQYHESGEYAWNPGCYITTPQFILSKLKEKNIELFNRIDRIREYLGSADEEKVTREEFEKMKKISIDYALWEKLDYDRVMVVLAEYGWHYVSTWSELKTALQNFPEENITKGKVRTLNSTDCLIYNFDDKKIVCGVGLDGIEIINTGDALLVVKKEHAAKVKDLVAELEKDEELNELV